MITNKKYGVLSKVFFLTVFPLVLAVTVSQLVVGAEKFPTKPIYAIVSRGAGGSTDLVSRTLAPFMQKQLGVPIVVQNMTGGGGDIGNQYVSRAEPDGYTITTTVFPTDMLRRVLRKLPFDVLEFTYLGAVSGYADVLAVPVSSPLKNWEDVKAEAKRKKLSFAMTARPNLSLSLLEHYTGLPLKHVPYSSGTESIMAVLGGHTDMVMASSLTAARVKEKIRVIAQFGRTRERDFPDAPTFIELGYQDIKVGYVLGITGPPNIPEDRAKILADAIAKAVKDPDFLELARKLDMRITSSQKN